ncbi:MAG: hypothetical protein ACRCX2_10165 [Paraclostridium sp.]
MKKKWTECLMTKILDLLGKISVEIFMYMGMIYLIGEVDNPLGKIISSMACMIAILYRLRCM